MMYPKWTPMITLKKKIEVELRAQHVLWRGGPTPKTASELLQAERKHTRIGRTIADLSVSRDILNAHLLIAARLNS